MVSVVIPAYNEKERVADVVRAAVSARFDEVIVVDDGSTDGTSLAAERAGARVITLSPNRGKGGAMKAGVDAARGDTILFLDADMTGFNKKNLRLIADPVERGNYEQIIGVSDDASSMTSGNNQEEDSWQGTILLSGQRAVQKSLLEKLPAEAWEGYGIEVWINDVVQRNDGRTGVFRLNRVFATPKWEKVGAARGFAKMADMMAEVFRTMQKIVSYYESNSMQYQKAPPAQTLEAQCSSTQCVADAISTSLRRAAWTDDVQQRFSERISIEVAKPIWFGAGCAGLYFFGPVGAVVAGAAWAMSSAFPMERGRPSR